LAGSGRSWRDRRLERLLPLTLHTRQGERETQAVWLDTLHLHLVLPDALTVGRSVDGRLTLPHARRSMELSLRPVEVVEAGGPHGDGWLHRARWQAAVLVDGDWLVTELPRIRPVVASSPGRDGGRSSVSSGTHFAFQDPEPSSTTSGVSRVRSRSRSTSQGRHRRSAAREDDDLAISGGNGTPLTALLRVDDPAAIRGRVLLGHNSFRISLNTRSVLQEGDELTLCVRLPQGLFVQVPGVVDQVRLGRLVVRASPVPPAQMFDLRQGLGIR